MNWKGVLPAITTNLHADLTVDHGALAAHCRLMIDSGCAGIVACGSLGEAATLTFDEKIAIVRTSVAALGDRAPVVLGIASLSTVEAVALARAAAAAGAQGLMVLPPYVYSSDWPEMKAHVSAVLNATQLPCMLYNNPVAYKTDFLPEHIAELAAQHANLQAVKESSGDTRRITGIKAVAGRRLDILVGMDDAVVEGVYAGAVGWVAGLVNAFPAESVALFDYASRGDKARAAALYQWFLPLLRLDTVPKFVQLIKWIQAEVGRGAPHVRPPRLMPSGVDLAHAQAVLAKARASHPKL
ncbi:MAG: dihydrodipicolinate synthase family protein [Opitutae bacterium]|nr:dihydrodipicolinate synthase family protein [Opitutae bacterium]